MSGERSVTVKFLGDASSAVRASNEVGGATEKTSGGLGKVAKLAAGLGAATAITSFGKSSIAAFKESEAANLQLNASLSKMPASVRPSFTELDKLAGALQKKTKFDDESIKSGDAVLANFVQNGDQLKSLTPIVLDYAAKTGKDVPDAATAVGKAMMGNAKALKSLGIDFHATGDKAKDMATVQALLTSKVGGFAEKEGKSAAGQSAILKNQFGELQEQVGGLLVPAITKLGTILLKVTNFLTQHRGVAIALGVVIAGALVIAFISWAAAAGAAAIATLAAVWPILAVIAVIALIVGAFILAYNHCSIFRAIVQGAFTAVLAAGRFLWSFLQTAFAWIWFAFSHFTPIGLLITHFGMVRDIAVGVFNFIRGAIEGFIGFFMGIPGRISSIASGMWNGIRDAFKSALNWVIDKWNGFSIHVDTHIPGIGTLGFDTPNIPRFAQGGFVPGPMGAPSLAIVHGGEQVLTPSQQGASAGGLVVNISGVIGDKREVGRAVVEAITEYERRSGARWRSA